MTKRMKQRELFEPRAAPVAKRPRRSTKVPHTIRPELNGPAHVVLRIERGLPWLRTPKTYRVLERAFRKGREKGDFRLIEYSVQRDHLHLVVEAGHRRHLTRGMQGLTIRIAKALNRFWRGRVGRVFADRYVALALTKRRQLWRTLRYVLNNGRKHGVWNVKKRPDPYSSGRWFLRWEGRGAPQLPLRSRPVVLPRLFELLALPGIQLDDMPGPRHFEEAETLESMLAS